MNTRANIHGLEPLLTDFYQLTMAHAYWKCGKATTPAVFSLFFRNCPFGGGFAIAAGLQWIIELLESFQLSQQDIDQLYDLNDSKSHPIFPKEFLEFLRTSPFSCSVQALPEGSVCFPNEPLLRVRGPIWQCQLLETILLNTINFQTLIATKAARMVCAAEGTPIVDFGLRRAQGPNGAMAATRAAYIGGIEKTSNVRAGLDLGIALSGTHAHSWVMTFDSETEAFLSYADCYPDQCVFLVDTYNTIRGIKSAIEVGHCLKQKGGNLMGIRLDSGDLAYLSQQARTLLDNSGFTQTKIIASNELDEHIIQSLRMQGAKIDVWGVGTKLVTAFDQPALNGVYKLSAILDQGNWVRKMKLSNQPAKSTNPGIPRICRFENEAGELEGDLIYDEFEPSTRFDQIFDPNNPQRYKRVRPTWKQTEPLERIFTEGKLIYKSKSLSEIRVKTQRELAKLHPGHKRLEYPHEYPVGLSRFLSETKQKLIETQRQEQE